MMKCHWWCNQRLHKCQTGQSKGLSCGHSYLLGDPTRPSPIWFVLARNESRGNGKERRNLGINGPLKLWHFRCTRCLIIQFTAKSTGNHGIYSEIWGSPGLPHMGWSIPKMTASLGQVGDWKVSSYGVSCLPFCRKKPAVQYSWP